MISILFTYLVAAAAFTFIKLAVGIPHATFFLSTFHLLPVGILFLWWHSFFETTSSVTTHRTPYIIVLVSVAFSLADITYLLALKDAPSSHVALISCLGPIATAIIGWFFFKERLTVRKGSALLLGLFGIMPLLISNLISATSNTSSASMLGGYFYAFVTTVVTAVNAFVLKELFQKNYTLSQALGTALCGGGIVSFIGALFFERWALVYLSLTSTFTLLTFIAFMAHNLLYLSLYGYAVKKYPIMLVSLLSLTTPLISATLEFLWFGKKVGWPFIASTVLLGISLLLFNTHSEKSDGC